MTDLAPIAPTEDDLALVCEIAFEWAGEYGFSDPKGATKVWEAAARLRPDLEPRSHD